ncbi:hypothetical protein ACIBKY_25390 [Nonomuraea sp. NPDC050394]|uniref:hypothetical protein n=1 Tax=Nonomuraea sp. NPDC050394 TaxID=3364363 RepID=UPI0037996242
MVPGVERGPGGDHTTHRDARHVYARRAVLLVECGHERAEPGLAQRQAEVSGLGLRHAAGDQERAAAGACHAGQHARGRDQRAAHVHRPPAQVAVERQLPRPVGPDHRRVVDHHLRHAPVVAVRHIRLLLEAGLPTVVIGRLLRCMHDDGGRAVPTPCPGMVNQLRRERARIAETIGRLRTSQRALDGLLGAMARSGI